LIRAYLARQMFRPGPLGIFVNPFYLARRHLDRHVAAVAPRLQGSLLDVGCGTKPYREYFTVDDYIGLEISDRSHDAAVQADVFYDGRTFPFDADRFDSVTLFQVLEHVFEPDAFLAEVRRVLKPGGRLLITVPFVWDEHEQPYDYGRYSTFGLRHLLDRNGFNVEIMQRSCRVPAAIFQLINAYLFKMTVTSSGAINAVMTAVLMAPFTLMGIVIAAVLPAHDDLYLDNIALFVKRPDAPS
jgi:SAM-dependent methyltransferase